jgi:predicted dehydrogenase
MSSPSPRVLVLGAGSIGARHARNLVAAGARVDVMDTVLERAEAIEGATARPLDVAALEGYAGVVVATPSSVHAEHGAIALSTGARVLIEKPLATSGVEATELAGLGGDRLRVAYNLRFHEPAQRAMAAIHDGSIGTLSSLRLWFGSWLPSWRPNIDYRTSYSAQSSLGGGVLLDAIHELDLLLWAVPDVDFEVVGAVVDRVGPLEIDVEDTVRAVLRTVDHRIVVEIALDYLARRYRRGLEATGDVGTVRLDWARQVLEVEHEDAHAVQAADTPVAASYEHQARAFVAWLQGGTSLPVDGATGAASVLLADAIRDAAS